MSAKERILSISKWFSDKAAGGIIVAILLTLLWTVWGKGQMVIRHIDQEMPCVSQLDQTDKHLEKRLTDEQASIDKLSTTVSGLSKNVGDALSNLKDVKREIESQPVRGRFDINGLDTSGDKVVYVNAYSDARKFGTNEKLQLVVNQREVEVVVGGVTFNKDDETIGQLNKSAADAVSLSLRSGWAKGTLRRFTKGD